MTEQHDVSPANKNNMTDEADGTPEVTEESREASVEPAVEEASQDTAAVETSPEEAEHASVSDESAAGESAAAPEGEPAGEPELEAEPEAETESQPDVEGTPSDPAAADVEDEPTEKVEEVSAEAETADETPTKAPSEPPAADAEDEPTEKVEEGSAEAETADETPTKAPSEPAAADAEDEPIEKVEEGSAEAETADETPAKAASGPAPARVISTPQREERPEVKALRAAQESKEPVDGKIIGWNNGGLHVVVNGITAFCPRSEIEIGAPKGPEGYLDKVLPFVVIRVQKRGRRIVLSRRALLQGDRDEKLETLRSAMRASEVLEGKVSSLTDFGAFVDLGGIDGLIHVSEISRTRIAHASEALSVGDEVKVRILKISEDGSRVSLSAKALEPDPWEGIEDRFPPGEMVPGTVERTAEFGAFIEIAPGLTGLLPVSAMDLPRNASPARAYQPGKEVSVQVLSIDRRRQRISLALEGSQAEGTRADLKSFKDKQSKTENNFGSLAAAFAKLRKDD
jgi:predicted RNA-binding protein with RPS1 domain